MSKIKKIEEFKIKTVKEFEAISKYRTIYKKRQSQELILKAINKALKGTDLGYITEKDEGFYLQITAGNPVYFKEPEDALEFLLNAIVYHNPS